MDAYIILSSTYNNPTVFWTSVFCNIAGLGLNSLFAYITIKIDDKRKSVDRAMVAATFVKIIHTAVIIVKSSCKYSLGEDEFDITPLYLFGVFDFLLRGLYTWFLLSLAIARILVLKKMYIIQNSRKRVKFSNIFMSVSTILTIISTTCYGFVLFFLDPVHSTTGYIITRTLKHVFIDASWVVVIILNIVLIIYMVLIYIKKNKTRSHHLSQSGYNDIRSRSNNETYPQRRVSVQFNTTSHNMPYGIGNELPSASANLIRQVLISIISLLIFNIVPRTYVYTIEVYMEVRKYQVNNFQDHIVVYGILSACLTIFNPISFGMFSKQRRNTISTLVEPSRLSNMLQHFRRPNLPATINPRISTITKPEMSISVVEIPENELTSIEKIDSGKEKYESTDLETSISSIN